MSNKPPRAKAVRAAFAVRPALKHETKVRQVKQPDEVGTDLEKTDELPVLDVASYEAQLKSGVRDDLTQPPDGGWHDPLVPSLPVLPPAEMLRDIDAWISVQDERARSYERAVTDLNDERAKAKARADALELELEGAQRSLHVALSRANDGERAALESSAAMSAAELRRAQLATELEQTKGQLTEMVSRAAAVDGELLRSGATLDAKIEENGHLQDRLSELSRNLGESTTRTSALERETSDLRAQVVQGKGELLKHADHVAAIRAASDTQRAAADTVRSERDALATRVASLLETLQSDEWKRNVQESVSNELELELSDARGLLTKLDAEGARLTAALKQTTVALSERDALITQLRSDYSKQSAAMEDLSAARTHEQKSHAISTQELHHFGEKLSADLAALEVQYGNARESAGTSEAQLTESRMALVVNGEKLRALEESSTARASRVVELEGLVADLTLSVQTHAQATRQADDLVAAREHALEEERARARASDTELHIAIHSAAEQTVIAQQTKASLEAHLEQLAVSKDHVTTLEREVASQSETLAKLRAELSRINAAAEQTESSNRALEGELSHARAELQREGARAETADSAQRSLALELERTRGALDERELQLRRLERFAVTSAEVLSRIRVGIERGEGNVPSEVTQLALYGATLVPLDDSDAPPLVLGRQTTIGRAPDSDLCLRHSSVSRRHAKVTIGSNGAFIEDLRSANGVTVNRRRIRQAQLKDGDVIELGLRRFRFTTAQVRTADAG